MLLWSLCLLLAGCMPWNKKHKKDEELQTIPVLNVSALEIKSLVKSDNNTEGYVTDLWKENLRVNCLIGGGKNKLILEILESTIIPFESRISFQVRCIYYLEGEKVKSEIEVKGNRDIVNTFNNAVNKVANDISNQIINNLHKDYGSEFLVKDKQSIKADNSYVASRSDDFVDKAVHGIDSIGDSAEKIGNSAQRASSKIVGQSSGINGTVNQKKKD